MHGCNFGEWRGGEPLERGKCRGQPRDEPGGHIKLRLAQAGARVGGVQIGGFPAPELGELAAERRKCMGKAGRARPRPRATQHRLLQCGNGDRVHPRPGGEPGERMLEQGQQRDRRNPAESRVRGETRK